MKDKYLIAVVGPTAIGKTSCGIEIAQFFNSEIISADSRQFFKEMKIGTAVPSAEELAAVPHHFIQHKSITEAYSVGDFERDAINKLEKIFLKQDIVVMVGGSGLYINAVVDGLDNFPDVNPSVREKLNDEHKSSGISSLQKKLEELDPVYFEKVDKENPHRLIRALEICIGTGKTYSSFLKNEKPKRNFKTIKIGLTAPREIIYERINKRVDIMIKEGLIEEAKKLLPYKKHNALNTVGYKELFAHFEGALSLDEAIFEIKKNTRRFAKRQLTWFKKDDSINWFDYTTPPQDIINFIKTSLRP